MSDLLVFTFEDKFKAEEVRLALLRLEKEHLVNLEDAAVVTRRDDGKVKLQQTYNLTAAGAASGSFWGLLIGLLFLNPLVGVVAGAASGALVGTLGDIGVNDEFMKELGESLHPNSSALFLLVRKATMDKVIDEIRQYNPRILRTSLSHTDEAELRALLQKKGVEAPSSDFRYYEEARTPNT